MRIVLIPMVVGLIALGLIWFLVAPNGELRLALSPAVQSDPQLAAWAFSLFQRADAAVDDAQRSHSILSFRDYDPAQPLIEVPSPETSGSKDLADFITKLVLETSIDQDSGQIAVSIDGIGLLQLLYSATPWYDYFLEIKELKTISCSEHEVGPCFEIAANISPAGSGHRTQFFTGSVDTLGRDLAVLVLHNAVQRGGDSWQQQTRRDATPPPYLLASSMPMHMSALAHATKGIAILQEGIAHPSCANLTSTSCSELASSALAKALTEAGDTGHPVAALGLSLIETQNALIAARKMRPAYEVEIKLQQAERLMQQALRSKFVRAELQRDGFIKRFKLVNLNGVELNDQYYNRSNAFICATESYRRGYWQECILRTQDIAEFPAVLKPYLEAARYDASLRQSQDSAARQAVAGRMLDRLTELHQPPASAQQKRRIWSLQQVYFTYACNYPDDVDRRQFERAASEYLDTAPDADARSIAKLDISRCWPDNNPLPTGAVETIIQNISTRPPDRARYRLELALAKYYVRLGEFDKALTLLKGALQLPYLGSFVQYAAEFEPLMLSPIHRNAFLDSYYAGLPTIDARVCLASEV